MQDYSRFNLQTLKWLAKKQGLEVNRRDGSEPQREDYINDLTSASEQSTSPGDALGAANGRPPLFTKLPPDLRVMVYHELLNPNDSIGLCPHILCCGKLINKKATPISYDDVVIDVIQSAALFKGRWHGNCGKDQTFSHAAQFHKPYIRPIGIELLPWPTFLLKATRIKLGLETVCRKGVGNAAYAWPSEQLQLRQLQDNLGLEANRALCPFCSSLSARHCIRKPEVNIRRDGASIGAENIRYICCPLVMLGKLETPTVYADAVAPSTFSQSVYTNSAIGSFGHSVSASASALALIEEAKAYKRVAEAAYLASDERRQQREMAYPPDRTALFSRLRQLHQQINGTPCPFFMRMYDEEWEQATRTAADDLRRALDMFDSAGLIRRRIENYQDVISMPEEWRQERAEARAVNGSVACAEQSPTVPDIAIFACQRSCNRVCG